MTFIKKLAAALLIAAALTAGGMAKAGEGNFEVLFEDKLDNTEGIAVCPDGGMFVAENRSGKIYRIVDDKTLELYREGFAFPAGMACGADNRLFVLEYTTGNITALVKKDSGVEAVNVAKGLKTPNAATVRSDGALFVSESDAGRVIVISKDGKVEELLKGITYANGLAFNDDESILYVASTTPGKVYLVSPAAESRGKKKELAKNLRMADGLTRDGKGNLYVALYAEGKVVRLGADGEKEVVVEGLKSPATPVIKNGAIYVTNLNGKGIFKVSLTEKR